MSADQPIIHVKNLTIATPEKTLVDNISFDLQQRERLAIVGESGSGKTLTSTALLGMLPHNLLVECEACHFMGNPLPAQNDPLWLQYRGKKILYLPQDAHAALNPCLTVGQQLHEMMRIAHPLEKITNALLLDALEKVHLKDPQKVLQSYPQTISGGMAQRILIAMSFLARPKLLIADEVLSGVDPDVREELLRLFDASFTQQGITLLFVTHDLSHAFDFCSKTMVMHNGSIVDYGDKHAIQRSMNGYTQKLLEARLTTC